MPTAAISAPPGDPVRCIEKFKPPAFWQKIYRSTSEDAIVRELEFAERVTRSGRDLEDQDVAAFELKSSPLERD